MRVLALAENPQFASDPEIRLREGMAALNAIVFLGKADLQREPSRQRFIGLLALVARRFPTNKAIQFKSSKANLSYAAQAARGWPYGAP